MSESKCVHHLMSHHPATAQRLHVAERHANIEELTPRCPCLATQSINASHIAEINDDHVWRVFVADRSRAKQIDSKIGIHLCDYRPESRGVARRNCAGESLVSKCDRNGITGALPTHDCADAARIA